MPALVDIHCHLLPGIDDGAEDLATSLAMARLAANDGTAAVIATPHQLGGFSGNRAEDIRRAVAALQRQLDADGVPLTVLAGADVRIEEGLIQKLAEGEVLTLADRGRHVLLELPHDVCFPLAGLLRQLAGRGIAAILSHPERNAGLQAQPRLVGELVDAGCLMQVTAGSYTGSFGPAAQRMAERLLAQGLVHFVASDGHGTHSRRPLLGRALARVAELAGDAAAFDLCCHHPAAVAAGADVPAGRRVATMRARGWRGLFARKAG